MRPERKKRGFVVQVNDYAAFNAKTIQEIAATMAHGYFDGLKVGDKVTITVEKLKESEFEGPEWEGT